MSWGDRFRRKRVAAVPLPWRVDKPLPEGYVRPPSTDELVARRAAQRPDKMELDPLPSPVPVVTDDDVEANEAGVLDGEFDAVVRGAAPALRSWLGSPIVAGFSPDSISDPMPLEDEPTWVGYSHLLGFGDMSISVIGDVGGHRRCFDDVLARLGVVGDVIPDGHVIVQVGDLVGPRNGTSRYLLHRVDTLMAANPGRWVQLMGNWESRHIPGFMPFDAKKDVEPLDATGVTTLRRWWDDGSLQIATAVRSGGRDVLITHAGLTSWMWRDLGEPRSADAAAELLNEAGRYATGFVGQSGEMCAPPRDSEMWSKRYGRPGPLWASNRELWTSWHHEALMPFDQVVGHTAPFYFNRNVWSPFMDGLNPAVLACATPDFTTRHVTFRHRCGATIHSIDPQVHAKAAVDTIQALALGVGQRLR
jgi:hypothetical protein